MYVLCHRKSRPTGRKIAAALGVRSRFQTVVPNDTIIVRWGNPLQPEVASIIQPARAIMKAGNKLVALTCMKAAGVPVPEFQREYPENTRDNVWLARNTHGMCGRDIFVLNGGDDYMTHRPDFYTKWVANRREYRIHVFDGRVIGVMGKYLDFPADAGDGYIKNYPHGYRFRTPPNELKPNRAEAAIAAVDALGLDFGAVDLVVGEDDNPYVLEVNTAPALAPLTAAKYLTEIKRLAADKGYEVNINQDAMEAFNAG